MQLTKTLERSKRAAPALIPLDAGVTCNNQDLSSLMHISLKLTIGPYTICKTENPHNKNAHNI